MNRVPGLVRDCGRPGAVPTTHSVQDITCTEAADLVLFTPEFAAAPPTGAGTQVVLDASGKVVSVRARGGSVPAGGTVLQGIGAAATWLTGHAVVGQHLAVGESVVNASTGRKLHLGAGDSAASAAPVLIRDGRIDIDAAAEGVVDPRDLSYSYEWANGRQPRTMAGVDGTGRPAPGDGGWPSDRRQRGLHAGRDWRAAGRGHDSGSAVTPFGVGAAEG